MSECWLQRGSCDVLYQSMLGSVVARVCCSLLWLSAAGCADARDADSELCARYKRALLRYQRVDSRYTSQPVDGSYDVYRCPMDDAPDVSPSLAECTTRLEEECPESERCDLGLTTQLSCTRGVLTPIRTDLRLPHDGIGEACSSGPSSADSGLSFIDGASRDCATQQCLSFQGGPPLCTCLCNTRPNEPTCECPSNFRCRRDLTAGSKMVHEAGYCLPASL